MKGRDKESILQLYPKQNILFKPFATFRSCAAFGALQSPGQLRWRYETELGLGMPLIVPMDLDR